MADRVVLVNGLPASGNVDVAALAARVHAAVSA